MSPGRTSVVPGEGRSVFTTDLPRPAWLLALLCLAMTFGGPALAKRHYVESYGIETIDCEKLAPCGSVEDALLNATAGDTVIVGPGSYNGGVAIVHPRIKVISVAGAPATILDVSGSGNATAGVEIGANASRAVFGQRRKGFTVTGDFENYYGMLSLAEQVRIEGNIIFDSGYAGAPGPADNIGVGVFGVRPTVRFNTVARLDSHGIAYDVSLLDTVKSRPIISSNAVGQVEGACILSFPGDTSQGRYQDNYLDQCRLAGIQIINGSNFDTSKDRITGNSILNGDGDGIVVQFGNPRVERNAISGHGSTDCPPTNYYSGIELYNTHNAAVKFNTIFNQRNGFYQSQTALHTQFTGNTVVGSGCAAIFMEDNAPGFQRFSNNNLFGGPVPFDFETTSFPGEIKAVNNLWGDWFIVNDDAPDLSGDPEADTLSTNFPDQFSFNPRQTPNRIPSPGTEDYLYYSTIP